ncbi:hypothetical protein [Leptolyngbya ohadii]|uniref:hypothetical protein n=1 Tax=Leptolyngbya ohadii TaxID=1962290 RepID=UPI000B59FD17|nr:hypothetical protein [Leptolyngbya ohadii]
MSEVDSEVDRFLPECRLCQFYSCDIHLRCAVHPSGVESDQCLDFTPYKPSSLPPAIEVYPPEKLKRHKKSA